MAEIHELGRINKTILEKYFGKLQTDETVLTEERAEHIRKKHPEVWPLFEKYGDKIIESPDWIINDAKHSGTVFMVKNLPDISMNVVVRVALETDHYGLKNSVMTSYLMCKRNLEKLILKNKTLYKME